MRGDGRRATSTRSRASSWRTREASAERARHGVQRDFPLARLTTVRTGGAAEFFARAASEAQLLELLAWAQRAGQRR